MRAYIRYGNDGEPIATEVVECREKMLPWQEKGLQYTASGYGNKIPTSWQVKHNNRWKRVYCRMYSNIGALYIVSGTDKLFLDIEA